MTRYTPSRQYLPAALGAMGLAGFSGWFATSWAPAAVAVVLFLLSAGVLIWLAFRPAIEIHERYLAVGKRVIAWEDVRRVDRTEWVSPLVVRLTLCDETKVLLIFPGDLESTGSLLRTIRRRSREALIDGIPHQQFWGEALPPAPDRKQLPSPRYRLLRDDDEAEVERLYQRLKTVGHLDPKNAADEK